MHGNGRHDGGRRRSGYWRREQRRNDRKRQAPTPASTCRPTAQRPTFPPKPAPVAPAVRTAGATLPPTRHRRAELAARRRFRAPTSRSGWPPTSAFLAARDASAAWQDRGTLNLPIAPVASKTGPRCGVDTIAGRPALFFDVPGTDDTDGVLTVNLDSILRNSDYTVLVVERRQTDAEGYILGTTGMSTAATRSPTRLPTSATTPVHSRGEIRGRSLLHRPGQWRLHRPDQLLPDILTHSAPAAIDVEVFDQTVGHKLAIDGTVVDHNTEMTPISGLSPLRTSDAPSTCSIWEHATRATSATSPRS